MRFQTTNTSVMVWFWMNSMLILEVLWNGGVIGRDFVPKEAKRSNSRQKSKVVPVPKQGGTGTTLQKPIGTGTGTTQQNQISTGTEQSGTGTAVSKVPRFCSFAHLSPNSYTDSKGTLLDD